MVCISAAFFLCGCEEQILHDLTEHEANKVLSRLHVGKLPATKVLQSDGRWSISVDEDHVISALTFLDSNRVLAPRTSVLPTNSKGGIVPSREEQWFRYERSVAVSIEESLSTIRGVLETRVHLNLPEKDPLFGTKKLDVGSGSVLLVVDDRYATEKTDVANLVSGAAGIPAQYISVLQSTHGRHKKAPDQSREVVDSVVPEFSDVPTTVGSQEVERVREDRHAVLPVRTIKDDQDMDEAIASSNYQLAGGIGILTLVVCTGSLALYKRTKRSTRFSLPQDDGAGEV